MSRTLYLQNPPPSLKARLIAFKIDLACYFALLFAFSGMNSELFFDSIKAGIWLVGGIPQFISYRALGLSMLIVPAFFVFSLFLLGQSPGQKIMGIKVIQIHQRTDDLDVWQIIARPYFFFVSTFFLLGVPALFSWVRQDRKQLVDFATQTETVSIEAHSENLPILLSWFIALVGCVHSVLVLFLFKIILFGVSLGKSGAMIGGDKELRRHAYSELANQLTIEQEILSSAQTVEGAFILAKEALKTGNIKGYENLFTKESQVLLHGMLLLKNEEVPIDMKLARIVESDRTSYVKVYYQEIHSDYIDNELSFLLMKRHAGVWKIDLRKTIEAQMERR